MLRATLIGAAVLTSLALCAGPARAQEAPAAKAKRLFDQGNDAFTDGRYADALASYRTSFKLVRRPRTLFNIATCQDRLGQLEGAYLDYERFLAIAEDRDAALTATARERMADILPRMRIPLRINSVPPGAAVYVDGATEMAGRTPLELSLAVGEHELRLSAQNHREATRTIRSAAGEHGVIDVQLRPLARLTITVEPADAVIRPPTGEAVTGRYSAVVEPGTYELEVTREGYESQRISIQVPSHEPVTRHVVLESYKTDTDVQPIVIQQDGRPRPGGGLRLAGLVSMGAGGLGLALGVKLGLDANRYSDAAHDHARDTGTWTGTAIDALDDAETAQTRMFIAYGVGGAALIAGGVLYYLGHKRASESPKASLGIAPRVGHDDVGVVVWGGF